MAIPQEFSRLYIIIIVARIACASIVGLADADGPDSWRVVNVSKIDVLNLRAEPSIGSKILYKIPYNARGIVAVGRLADRRGEIILDTDVAVSMASTSQTVRSDTIVPYTGTIHGVGNVPMGGIEIFVAILVGIVIFAATPGKKMCRDCGETWRF